MLLHYPVKCLCVGPGVVSPEKTSEPIGMPWGGQTWNYVLDGVQIDATWRIWWIDQCAQRCGVKITLTTCYISVLQRCRHQTCTGCTRFAAFFRFIGRHWAARNVARCVLGRDRPSRRRSITCSTTSGLLRRPHLRRSRVAALSTTQLTTPASASAEPMQLVLLSRVPMPSREVF